MADDLSGYKEKLKLVPAAGVDECHSGPLSHQGFWADSFCHFVSLRGPNDHYTNIMTLEGHSYTYFIRCVEGKVDND